MIMNKKNDRDKNNNNDNNNDNNNSSDNSSKLNQKNFMLNRISKEIRIKIEIKNIYDEATCLFNTYFIKKKINKQKTTTNKFKLQFVYNRSFAVQQIHKMYFVIYIYNLFVFI